MERFHPNHPQHKQEHDQHQQRSWLNKRNHDPQHSANQSQYPWQHQGPQGHQEHYKHPPAPQPHRIHRQIMIEDAIQIGREQVPGQVIKVELERKGGRLIYEVEIVNPQGIKYEVMIDANSGMVLGIELD